MILFLFNSMLEQIFRIQVNLVMIIIMPSETREHEMTSDIPYKTNMYLVGHTYFRWVRACMCGRNENETEKTIKATRTAAAMAKMNQTRHTQMHILSVGSHIRTYDGIIVHGERVVDIHSCYISHWYARHTNDQAAQQQPEEEHTYPVCCVVRWWKIRSYTKNEQTVDEKKNEYTHTNTASERVNERMNGWERDREGGRKRE